MEDHVDDIGNILIEIYIRNQWERAMLIDVLYVPTLHINLFFVSSASFKNVETLYTKTSCQNVGWWHCSDGGFFRGNAL